MLPPEVIHKVEWELGLWDQRRSPDRMVPGPAAETEVPELSLWPQPPSPSPRTCTPPRGDGATGGRRGGRAWPRSAGWPWSP